MTYGAEALLAEVAYVAYHFHWSRQEILDLEHRERRGFVDRIGQLNARAPRG